MKLSLLTMLTFFLYNMEVFAQEALNTNNGVKTTINLYEGALNTNQSWGGKGMAGMYMFNARTTTDAPTSSDWYHMIEMQHDQGNNWTGQIALGYFTDGLYYRQQYWNNWGAWHTLASQDWVQSLLNTRLTLQGSGTAKNVTGDINGDLVIKSNTGGRDSEKGAMLEFVIPANQDGSNPWGQARILAVAGNADNGNATGKMLLGTRRYINKTGAGPFWYYGEDITIDGSGNIGIGTTTPDQKLTVKGGIGFDYNAADKKLYSPQDGTLEWMTHNGAYEHGFAVSHQGNKMVYLNTGGSSYINGGNMGIGTEHPAELLELKSSKPIMTYHKPGIASYKIGIDDGGVFRIAGMDNSYGGHGGNFQLNDTQVLVMNKEGNVGIGTVSPKERLSVNGNIRSKEIKVETANWPDYVFEAGYQGKSLKELEHFIKVNKHLPEVPSAAVAEREGVALGEMNKILIKKIEELTLHLIDQDKKLDRQQKQLGRMQSLLRSQSQPARKKSKH